MGISSFELILNINREFDDKCYVLANKHIKNIGHIFRPLSQWLDPADS